MAIHSVLRKAIGLYNYRVWDVIIFEWLKENLMRDHDPQHVHNLRCLPSAKEKNLNGKTITDGKGRSTVCRKLVG